MQSCIPTYCCLSVEATRTILVILGSWGMSLSVGAQMADKANPCPEGSLAVWTGDDRNVW